MNVRIIVMPAWMTGIQARKDTSGNMSMLTWIPAFHAGMTQLKASA
jgi:hypothetical protein